MPPSGITLSELAAQTGSTVHGDGAVVVRRVGSLEHAGPDAIAFLAGKRFRGQLANTGAAAVIVAPAAAEATELPRLVHGNPYATYARVAALLHPALRPAPGRHPTALIGEDALVDPAAVIGPYVVIGARARIGPGAVLGAGTIVGDDVVLGEDVLLHPRVVLYSNCTVGARTIIHSGAVIGADGFGMAEESGRWLKIPQIGGVVIGADCEIGACTTIDRGAIEDTVLEDDVKLDNQIQIGHNCRIGTHTAMAGCVGVAGSTTIGRNCKVGGAAMIAGHLVIVDNTVVSGASQVFESLDRPGVYTGTFPALPHSEWRHVASEVRRLRELARRVAALERALALARPDAVAP